MGMGETRKVGCPWFAGALCNVNIQFGLGKIFQLSFFEASGIPLMFLFSFYGSQAQLYGDQIPGDRRGRQASCHEMSFKVSPNTLPP